METFAVGQYVVLDDGRMARINATTQAFPDELGYVVTLLRESGTVAIRGSKLTAFAPDAPNAALGTAPDDAGLAAALKTERITTDNGIEQTGIWVDSRLYIDASDVGKMWQHIAALEAENADLRRRLAAYETLT